MKQRRGFLVKCKDPVLRLYLKQLFGTMQPRVNVHDLDDVHLFCEPPQTVGDFREWLQARVDEWIDSNSFSDDTLRRSVEDEAK